MSSKFAEMAEKLATERGLFELAERAALSELGLSKKAAEGDAPDEPEDLNTFMGANKTLWGRTPKETLMTLPRDAAVGAVGAAGAAGAGWAGQRVVKGMVQGGIRGVMGEPNTMSPLYHSGYKNPMFGPVQDIAHAVKPNMIPEAPMTSGGEPSLGKGLKNIGKEIGHPVGKAIRKPFEMVADAKNKFMTKHWPPKADAAASESPVAGDAGAPASAETPKIEMPKMYESTSTTTATPASARTGGAVADAKPPAANPRIRAKNTMANSTAIPGIGQDEVQAGFEAAGRAGKQVVDKAKELAPKVRSGVAAAMEATPRGIGAAADIAGAAGGGFIAGKAFVPASQDIASEGVAGMKKHPVATALMPGAAAASYVGGKMTPAGTSALATHPAASSALETGLHGARKAFNAAADVASGGIERRMDASGDVTGDPSFYEKNVQQPVAKGLENIGKSNPGSYMAHMQAQAAQEQAKPKFEPGASMSPAARAPALPANWETMGNPPASSIKPSNFKPIGAPK